MPIKTYIFISIFIFYIFSCSLPLFSCLVFLLLKITPFMIGYTIIITLIVISFFILFVFIVHLFVLTNLPHVMKCINITSMLVTH